MREFVRGAGLLLRGFGWWRRRPRIMTLGLVPAAIVGAILGAGLVVLAVLLPPLTIASTPFADAWPSFWAIALRVAAGVAVFGGALVLAVVSFTALTLVVGEPFYERISRTVELDLGGTSPDEDYGFWASVRDGLSLVGRGIIVAVIATAIGFLPIVGGVLGFITGVVLTGWVLADELCSRSLTARGILREERRRMLRANRARALGFGIATQLCFLVPFGAVAVMPAAVAGAALLARSVAPDDGAASAT